MSGGGAESTMMGGGFTGKKCTRGRVRYKGEGRRPARAPNPLWWAAGRHPHYVPGDGFTGKKCTRGRFG